MEEDLLNVYNEEMKYPLKILEIFNEFFGEERVDMQGFPSYQQLSSHPQTALSIRRAIPEVGYILVHFPHITVTNENDRSTEINHLFAKVEITKSGKLNNRFALNRSEYSYLHISNGYMHSHMSSIPFDNFTIFDTPCTGTGPINHTMASLFGAYNEDLWRLFCLELDKFVQVESLAGTPYYRLESLSLNTRYYYENVSNLELSNALAIKTCYLPVFASFTKHLIDSNILKFVYNGNSYSLGMSPVETLITVSNCFIKWYNKCYTHGIWTNDLNTLLSDNILFNCKYKDGTLSRRVSQRDTARNYLSYEDQLVCIFKEQAMRVHIVDMPSLSEEENCVKILNNQIVQYIITKILNIINLRYGRERKHDSEDTSSNQEVRII